MSPRLSAGVCEGKRADTILSITAAFIKFPAFIAPGFWVTSLYPRPYRLLSISNCSFHQQALLRFITWRRSFLVYLCVFELRPASTRLLIRCDYLAIRGILRNFVSFGNHQCPGSLVIGHQGGLLVIKA